MFPSVRPNLLKAKLRNNEVCFGIVMRLCSEEIVEMAGATGCDFVVIDMEHEAFNLKDAQSLIRITSLCGMTPIVRLGRAWLHHIDPLLAAGAQGFSLARVRNVGDIAALADAVLYHPEGHRTVYALGRSGRFGYGVEEGQWAAQVNSEIMLQAIIEEADAIDDIDAIIAHPRLDVVECGAKDLRQSMGMPPMDGVRQIVRDVFTKAAAAGKGTAHSVLGHVTTPEKTTGLSYGSGTMLIASPSDMVVNALGEMIKLVKGEAA